MNPTVKATSNKLSRGYRQRVSSILVDSKWDISQWLPCISSRGANGAVVKGPLKSLPNRKMGDFDICSKDPEIDNMHDEISGRKNESIFPFLYRSFKETCKRIAEPPKTRYESSDLNFSESIMAQRRELYAFELVEFDIVSRGLKLHCAVWKSHAYPDDTIANQSKSSIPCIIYTHTNTRSLADATELQPLAALTGFHILAFDMPGAGKSEGMIAASCAPVIDHIDDMISWAKVNLNVTEIILWARGMSTAATVEYSSSSATRGKYKDCVKYIVLDTPYCSVKQVVDNVVQKYKNNSTFSLISPLFYTCALMFGREVTCNLGSNIYAVKPINFASKNKTPCLILCARSDDYVPTSHSDEFLTQWAGPVRMMSINGTHYSRREQDVVLLAANYFKSFVRYPVIDRA